MSSYAELLAEARAEFDSWDRASKTVVVGKTPDGSRVWFKKTKGRPHLGICIDCGAAKSKVDGKPRCTSCKLRHRGANHEPCVCGAPYYAGGKCKQCYNRDYSRQRDGRGEAKQKTNARLRRWLAAHPEKRREYQKRFAAKYPERIRDNRNRWRENNPEKVREMKRKQSARYREKKRAGRSMGD